MRKLFFTSFAICTLLLSSAFAQELGSSTSLKQNMKQLGVLFKAMGSSVNDSSQNAQNAANSEKMNELFKIVFAQVPEPIDELPASEKDVALSDYRKLIQQELDLSEQLHQAFLDNDNQKAASLLQRMGDIRKDGHGKFKE